MLSKVNNKKDTKDRKLQQVVLVYCGSGVAASSYEKEVFTHDEEFLFFSTYFPRRLSLTQKTSSNKELT